MAEMRATQECQKCGGKAIANHVDRTFDIYKAENINPEKVPSEKVYVLQDDGKLHPLPKRKGLLAQEELNYYNKTFGSHIQDQKEKYLSKRQNARADGCTIEKYYENSSTGLTRIIYQVGKEGEYTNEENFAKMVSKQAAKIVQETEEARIRVVSVGLHYSETSIHGHVGISFEVKDSKGIWVADTEKCLEKLGYDLPFPDKKKSRYNNRKVKWTEESRTKWMDTIEKVEPDIKIIREPSKDNPMTKGKANKTIYELKELVAIMTSLEAQIDDLSNKLDKMNPREFEKAKKSLMDALEDTKRVFGQKKAQLEPYLPKKEVVQEEEEETIDDIEL